jgi:hypothetical protein
MKTINRVEDGYFMLSDVFDFHTETQRHSFLSYCCKAVSLWLNLLFVFTQVKTAVGK